jgi:hypothetical protein
MKFMASYEQLKKIIQVANPEIMELKFGCEVEIPTSGEANYKRYKAMVEHARLDEVIAVDLDTFGQWTLRQGRDYKILGRPIRLADVLLALEKSKSLYYAFDGKGYLLTRSYGTDDFNLSGLPFLWNLHDDNLDHQSEETKQFLIYLLTQ